MKCSCPSGLCGRPADPKDPRGLCEICARSGCSKRPERKK